MPLIRLQVSYSFWSPSVRLWGVRSWAIICIYISGWRGGKRGGRAGGRRRALAYPRPRRRWTWWRRTSPTPCGCRPGSGRRPRGTWVTGWTGRWSTTARTAPSSCRSGRTSNWRNSPPGWVPQWIIRYQTQKSIQVSKQGSLMWSPLWPAFTVRLKHLGP